MCDEEAMLHYRRLRANLNKTDSNILRYGSLQSSKISKATQLLDKVIMAFGAKILPK